MNRLPNEIIFIIDRQLTFEDKLQCALTCRAWYAKIINTVLYSKLRLKYPQSDDRTKANMKYMYDKALGYQVLDLQMKELDDPLEISELYPNLKSLQLEDCKCEIWDDCNNEILAHNWERIGVIKETCTCYLLVTMKLLDAPLNMRSLTSLRMDLLYQSEESLQMFIEKLKHAPMLERLDLENVFYLNCERLGLLHENAPNLNHLELKEVNYLFVGSGDGMEEHHLRPMNTYTASKLRKLCISFETQEGFVLENWEINAVRCIEYISLKYTNLTDVIIHNSGVLGSQNSKNIVTGYLKNAFRKWNQLQKFDMRLIPLSSDILEAMDVCNICLEELKMYIHSKEDMEQFVSLAHSKQGQMIKRLVVDDDTLIWPSQDNLVHFLQSLTKNKGQLNAIDINLEYYSTEDLFNVLTPIQVLDYVPSLQRLSMRWDTTRDMKPIIYKQPTHLVELDLELFQLDDGFIPEQNTFNHIQDLIYASPLLQSFSILFWSIDAIIDLQLNTKLKTFNCSAQDGYTFQIIQNQQTRQYTFGKSETYSAQNTHIEEESQRDNGSLTLHLPPSLHSLFINGTEYSF